MLANKPRILVLYTGGTVGMESSEDGFVPMNDFADLLTEELKGSQHAELPEFDFFRLETLIDSANLVPANWTILGNKLLEVWDDYQGFVILHGTDTMTYTASALSFMFQGLDKPIVVTGSQIPLSVDGSDALENVGHAMLLAAQYQLHEVCICFNGQILRGNRSSKYQATDLNAFISPNYPSLGVVKESISLETLSLLKRKERTFSVPDFECNSVLVLQVFPGISKMDFSVLLLGNAFKAVIIQTYGMGNTPNTNSSLTGLLEYANQNDIIVLNITQCMYGSVDQQVYSTGKAMNRLGVIEGRDMTLEAAYSKLHFLLALGLSSEEIKRKLAIDLSGEMTH